MKLSKREQQVADKVALCKKRSAIASELEISVSTVDVYLLRIRRKIGVSSMLEMAVFFTKETFLPHSRE